MKVGLIGLGRMGEGMSRRMLKAGIEVWGYRRNYAKAQEAYEAGYVSGIATNLESLVQVVHDQPGIIGKSPSIQNGSNSFNVSSTNSAGMTN